MVTDRSADARSHHCVLAGLAWWWSASSTTILASPVLRLCSGRRPDQRRPASPPQLTSPLRPPPLHLSLASCRCRAAQEDSSWRKQRRQLPLSRPAHTPKKRFTQVRSTERRARSRFGHTEKANQFFVFRTCASHCRYQYPIFVGEFGTTHYGRTDTQWSVIAREAVSASSEPARFRRFTGPFGL